MDNHIEASQTNTAVDPLRVIVNGTAGTGKSFVISSLKKAISSAFGDSAYRLACPTGLAAYLVKGVTLHSLFSIPTSKKLRYKPLSPAKLLELQEKFRGMRYLLIDEMSMVGRRMLAFIDARLREIFSECSDQYFGGVSVFLFGDFGQLPPVGDCPMYVNVAGDELSGDGFAAYRSFTKSVKLTIQMRQSGSALDDEKFRDALLRLRDGQTTEEDWRFFLGRVPNAIPLEERRLFDNSVHLFPTKEAVKTHNAMKLNALNRQVVTLNAVHFGNNAERAESDKAGGLDATLQVCIGAKVMLTTNMATHYGLVNGSSGIIKSIIYENDAAPPNLPKCILVEFECYSGPAFLEDMPKVVPILPLKRSWSSAGSRVCSRTQFPFQLGWALTIHKSQGMTLEKAVVELGKNEFSIGISFVAISRVKKIKTLLFKSSFDLTRLTKLKYSVRMNARLIEEQRLISLGS